MISAFSYREKKSWLSKIVREDNSKIVTKTGDGLPDKSGLTSLATVKFKSVDGVTSTFAAAVNIFELEQADKNNTHLIWLAF